MHVSDQVGRYRTGLLMDLAGRIGMIMTPIPAPTTIEPRAPQAGRGLLLIWRDLVAPIRARHRPACLLRERSTRQRRLCTTAGAVHNTSSSIHLSIQEHSTRRVFKPMVFFCNNVTLNKMKHNSLILNTYIDT